MLKRGDEGVGGAFRFQLSYGSELDGFVFPAQGKQIGDSAVQVLLNTKSILLGQLTAKAHLAFHSLKVGGVIIIIIITIIIIRRRRGRRNETVKPYNNNTNNNNNNNDDDDRGRVGNMAINKQTSK